MTNESDGSGAGSRMPQDKGFPARTVLLLISICAGVVLSVMMYCGGPDASFAAGRHRARVRLLEFWKDLQTQPAEDVRLSDLERSFQVRNPSTRSIGAPWEFPNSKIRTTGDLANRPDKSSVQLVLCESQLMHSGVCSKSPNGAAYALFTDGSVWEWMGSEADYQATLLTCRESSDGVGLRAFFQLTDKEIIGY